MGYDVHITRASHWVDGEATPITLEEWRGYVASDPEMRMDNFAGVVLDDGSLLRQEAEGLAVWTPYSGNTAGGNQAWFLHHDGNIVVKGPDRELLGKMLRIAVSLNANVQGDDGEIYSRIEDLPNDCSTASAARRLWWRFWGP